MKNLILKKNIFEKEIETSIIIIENINKNLIDLNNRINNILKKLENEIPTYIDHLNKLNLNIYKLRQKLNLNNIEEISITQLHNIDIKYLYKLIVSKCHPDKTDNKVLNDLFIIASTEYKFNNYAKILNIYTNLLNNKFIHNKITIEERSNLIKIELKNRKNEYEKILETKGYIIMKQFNSDNKYIARKIFLNMIIDEIIELEQLKKDLTKNLNMKGEPNAIQQL